MSSKKYIPQAEISVVEHCNLNCNLCNAHAYLIKESTYPLDRYKKDMDVLAENVHFGMMTFMGGEPLLCKNLVDYVNYARDKKLAGIYRILTNGILIRNMSPELMTAIDVVEVSHYPEMKDTIEEIDNYLKPLSKEFKFTYYIKTIGFFNKIDTTSLSDEEAQRGYEQCGRIEYVCSIFNGYYYKCMRPKTTNLYLEKCCGITCENDMRVTDGLEISDDRFRERLDEYINSPKMLEACKYCLMGVEKTSKPVKTIRDSVVRHPAIIKVYYKVPFLYRGYKRFKKMFIFDEGAYTSGDAEIDTQSHTIAGKSNG